MSISCRSRSGLRLSLVSLVAFLCVPAMVSADPVTPGVGPMSRAPAIPVLTCIGPDCAAGEGFLGDAPAHMAIIAEADLGESECGEGGCEYERYEDEVTRESPEDPPGLSIGSGGVANAIDAAREHCETYSIHWRIDCLSSELRAAADRLGTSGDSGVIRAELIKASDELAQIAAANAYAAQPPVVRTTEVNGTTRRTNRPIRSIAAARLPAVNAAATAVLDNLSTTLLRSAPSAAARQANFERAAQAVDSAKVLLRSA